MNRGAVPAARGIVFWLVVGWLIGCLTGCLSVPLDADYTGPQPLPEQIRQLYHYKKVVPEVKQTVLSMETGYQLRRVEFTPGHSILPFEHHIQMDYYDIHGDQPVPVIMVLPILGGGNGISSAFARFFARNGYAVLLVHRQKKYKELEHLDYLNEILQQIVFDHMQAIDWLETQPDVDVTRIGVFGISMGGIKSALVSALESRVRAGVVALAAGNIPHVLSYSEDRGVRKKRDKLLAKQNVTADQLYQRLAAQINCDPLNYAPYMDARNILMILARFDRSVTYWQGRELKERMGNPETIYLLSGHYSSLLYWFYIQKEALMFFNRKLDVKKDPDRWDEDVDSW